MIIIQASNCRHVIQMPKGITCSSKDPVKILISESELVFLANGAELNNK